MVTLTILGAGKEVGRAAIAVEHRSSVVLLDYGVNFDDNDLPQLPLHYPPAKLKGIVLTHGHLDHIGGAPIFYISRRPIAVATSFTRDVAEIMLRDFLKLSGYYLPFEDGEVADLLSTMRIVGYGEDVELGSIVVRLRDSGHIPGSAMVEVETGSKKIVYTGDINFVETKLVGPADVSGLEADVIIIESTYGTSEHPPRREVEERFYNNVLEVVENGGTVLVPAFSLGRGQEILCVLVERGFDYPIYVDGMVRGITELMLERDRFLRDPELLRKAYDQANIVRGWQDRRNAWKEPGVIIASAGMLKGGPSRFYLRKLAKNERNAIFMVSFQAPGTPGRRILEEGKYTEEGPMVKARVEWFDFSSHAGRTELLEIIKRIKGLEKVIVVHGEPEVAEAFAEDVRVNLGIDAIVPSNGEKISLD